MDGRSVPHLGDGGGRRGEVGGPTAGERLSSAVGQEGRKPLRRSQKSKTWRKPLTNSRGTRSSRCAERSSQPPAVRGGRVGCGERRPCRGAPRRAVVSDSPGAKDAEPGEAASDALEEVAKHLERGVAKHLEGSVVRGVLGEARSPSATQVRRVRCGERRPCHGDARRAVVPGSPGLPDWASPCFL